MILIISFHYVYKSNFTFEELSVNSFIVKVFYMFGELGVNLFILITGYFMVTGKFSVKKLIYLIIEVNFYYLLSILIGQKLGTTEIAYFWTPNTMLMFLLSVSIFEIFLNIKMKSIKIVNIIASTTLGIYMIHDGVLQRYIWDTIFKTTEHLSNNSWKIIIDIMIATIIIFIVGTIIDLIRQFIEKITIKKILDLKIFNRKSEEK